MKFERTSPKGIKDLMNHHDLRFQKQFGQNFLIDGNVVDNIVKALELEPEDRVLEIGPGIGALTERLIQKTPHVTAVEIDRNLVDVIRRSFPEVDVISGDILKQDPLQFPQGIKIVGNLPYYITSAIIMHFLESELAFERLVIMMQKEVAERISAGVGSKDYGVLTVITRLFCEVEYLFTVSRHCYMPAPRVDSAVVRLKPVPKQSKALIPVIKAAFSSRRKTLLNALQNSYDKERVQQALLNSGINPARRAETLTLEEFIRLGGFLL